jgi:hypothetical protein
MGTDLMAYRKPNVQHGIREDTIEKEYIDSYRIWENWRDSNINTWPKCLQNFWWKIHDYESAQTCATNIRKYYLYDTELCRFASWLESFDTDIIFELSI